MRHVTWITLLFWLPGLGQMEGNFINSGGICSDDFSYAIGEIFIVEIKTSSEDEVRPQLLVKAHPNPTSQTVHLNIEGDLVDKKVQVYDLNGRLLLQKKLKNPWLDISGLPTGVYLIKSASEEFQTIKILKN